MELKRGGGTSYSSIDETLQAIKDIAGHHDE